LACHGRSYREAQLGAKPRAHFRDHRVDLGDSSSLRKKLCCLSGSERSFRSTLAPRAHSANRLASSRKSSYSSFVRVSWLALVELVTQSLGATALRLPTTDECPSRQSDQESENSEPPSRGTCSNSHTRSDPAIRRGRIRRWTGSPHEQTLRGDCLFFPWGGATI
jgi:hypothetical protein